MLACFEAAQATELRRLDVKVVRITDGDTIVVLDSNQLEHRVRLAGIDAPEKSQAFGDRSRKNLASLVAGKEVKIEWSKEDKYGRFVALVLVPRPVACDPPICRSNYVDANLSQVAAGFAWHYKEYEQEQTAQQRRDYSEAELAAKGAQVGLWTDPHPTPPWDFRHGPTEGPVKKSRNAICHDAGMSTYKSVQKFESFDTLEACIESGGRLPKNVAQ